MVIQAFGRTLCVLLVASLVHVSSSEGDGSLDGVCAVGEDCEGGAKDWYQEFKDVEMDLVKTSHVLADGEVEIGGMALKVSNSVFHPGHFDLSGMYPDIYDALDVSKICKSGGKFLELGTGTGYFALQAAKDGCIVTATDINPQAVKDTKLNAERLGLADRVTCLESDVYNGLAGSGEKFDAIWWHWPYGQQLSDEEETMPKFQRLNLMDEGYKLLARFLGEGGKYLKPDGKLMVAHGKEIGNRPLFNQRVAESGVTIKHVKTLVDPADFVKGVRFTSDFYEVRYTK